MINQYMGVALSTFQVVYIYETHNLLRFDAWGSTLVMLWDTQLSGFMLLYRVSIICGILKCLLLADAFFFRYFCKTWITSEPLQVSRWWSQKKQTILCKICTDGFILSHCSWFRWKKMTCKKCECQFGVPVRWQDLLTSTFRISYTYFWIGYEKKQQGINERVLHELVCLGRCIPMTKNSVIDGFKMYVSTM